MIVLEALFILTCYGGVVVGGMGNVSVPQTNDSELQRNVSLKVTAIVTVKEDTTEGPTNVIISSPDPTNTTANVNNGSSSHNASNTSVAKDRDDANEFFLQDEFYKMNEPFFSKEFKTRLEIWRKTLINASRQCIKLNNNSKPDIEGNLEIVFPVFRVKEDIEGGFFSFDTLRPVLVRQNKAHDLVNIAYLSILELWPLLVLCFSCAALSGILIWLLDTRSNSEQFPKRFWRGIFDGMWWAVVTMSTVGYGDKSPKSFFARLFATVWMITGIILLSMFTAQVSSRLITQELQSGDHLFNKRVGVPPGLYYSDYVDYKMTYSIVQEISRPNETAATSKHKKLDSEVVFHCEEKQQEHWEILQFMPPCQVGASVAYVQVDVEHDYFKCMKNQLRKTQSHRKGPQDKKKMPHESCDNLLEKHDNLKFEFKWVYFKNIYQYLIPFGAVIGTILIAFLIGAIWDCRKKRKRADLENSQRSFMLQESAAESMIAENNKY